jgi:eukaryotic-like serine/threonine-protein kinase
LVPVGELIAERYELVDLVGSGGMSSVYCAFDTLLERRVALKILHERFTEDDDYVERFRREARAVAQLSHPNIVTVIDRGERDGTQFIVFELVDGENLKELVERGGPLPVRRALDIGLDVARALAFAHAQGLVHRDVKPQNVLLTPDGHAKVTDFGIVRSLGVAGNTETGTVLGTSQYIAPEQARGEHVDAQTDVYSFGVVLYELLAGEVPYDGESFLTVAMRHVNDPVPNVVVVRPDTPLRLATLVESCMAKAPADRPESMDVVVSELEACLGELDAKGGEESTMIIRQPVEAPPSRARRPARRRRAWLPLLVVLVGALLLAAAIAAVALLRDESPGAAGRTPVRVQGIASFDPPPGDGEEHSERVGDATDGDPETYWTTESYRAFTKPGVGLVLEASAPPRQLALSTDTPGFSAEIRAGNSADGPFDTIVGPEKTVESSTTWDLENTDARYLVIWITRLDEVAHVNTVEAN